MWKLVEQNPQSTIIPDECISIFSISFFFHSFLIKVHFSSVTESSLSWPKHKKWDFFCLNYMGHFKISLLFIHFFGKYLFSICSILDLCQHSNSVWLDWVSCGYLSVFSWMTHLSFFTFPLLKDNPIFSWETAISVCFSHDDDSKHLCPVHI